MGIIPVSSSTAVVREDFQPRVSIVIPIYNGVAYLDETLQSVLGQTLQDWELLLIDDGSTDGSSALARRYAARYSTKIRYVEHPGHSNRGQFATRILGAHYARGDVVALLDQDDLWDRDYLEKHLRLWDSLQGHGAFLSYGPSLYWFPEDPTGSKDFVQPMPPGAPKVYAPGELLEAFLSSKYRNTPLPSCTFIHRGVLGKVTQFERPAKASQVEDQYLWWYVASRWPVAVHCGVWVRHRQHRASAFRRATASRGLARRVELTFLKAISEDLSSQKPAHPLLGEGRLAARIERLAARRDLRQEFREVLSARLPPGVKSKLRHLVTGRRRV